MLPVNPFHLLTNRGSNATNQTLGKMVTEFLDEPAVSLPSNFKALGQPVEEPYRTEDPRCTRRANR